jgi:hypothetical protein
MRATFLLSSALALTFCFSPLANSQIFGSSGERYGASARFRARLHRAAVL